MLGVSIWESWERGVVFYIGFFELDSCVEYRSLRVDVRLRV